MRRAMPKPCSGPSACSVFKIIRSSVPCSTSDFFDFMVRSVLLFARASFPRRDASRDWRPQFPSFALSKGAYHLSFAMSIGRRCAAVVFSLGYHSLLEPRIKTPVSNEHSGKTKTFNTQDQYLRSRLPVSWYQYPTPSDCPTSG